MAIITIDNLKKHFGSTKAVDGISFSVESGEIFGFLGPNGAGKTTTIRCLMDFIRPDDGRVTIAGLDSRADSAQLKQKIGYLSPDIHLYEYWTGQQHIDFLENLHPNEKSHSKELIKKLSLNPKVRTKNLSSGNKQKLSLIMALMFQPEIAILDEPTAALDPLLQNTIYEILKDYQAKGSTIFFSSHNLAEVERICSRVAIIRQGKLVKVESIDKLRQMRIHLINARFTGEIRAKEFELPDVQDITIVGETLTARVKGDLNPMMQALGRHQLADLEISHASLEDIFLSFYERS